MSSIPKEITAVELMAIEMFRNALAYASTIYLLDDSVDPPVKKFIDLSQLIGSLGIALGETLPIFVENKEDDAEVVEKIMRVLRANLENALSNYRHMDQTAGTMVKGNTSIN